MKHGLAVSCASAAGRTGTGRCTSGYEPGVAVCAPCHTCFPDESDLIRSCILIVDDYNSQQGNRDYKVVPLAQGRDDLLRERCPFEGSEIIASQIP